MRARTLHDVAAPVAYTDGVNVPRLISSLIVGACVMATGALAQAQPQTKRVVVNRQALTAQEVHSFESQFGVQLSQGRYWYDARSGAWGAQGGPMQGVLPPGLRLGGALWRQASNGDTGVVVNGRELHRLDVARLVAAGVPVQRGAFWLNANGVGGPEGGPPAFNLKAMLTPAPSGRRSVLSTYDRTGIAVY